ncbi:hypothetical protein O3Q52_41055 [Streptomyces sp. ActVer]|uniref:hypothetical protein n=1 Tax=Streptomyces sp. ActVer TaxID=3014558 RepID=UPI0022B32325|nr:hypothetical protein [Streptomyces sp. ActVer]MCZ4514414.1 hypothetical protein [Streptomyces sp. ActVer]
MVSSSHEALHHFGQKDTAGLIRNLQRLFHVPFPEPCGFTVLNTDLTEIEPVERRADSVVRVNTKDGDFLLVLESQGKKDERKRGSWPYYLSYLYEKYRCEPVLVVMTQSSSTARWAAQPIRFGLPGWSSLVVRPMVLGPDNVPVITDEKEAAQDVSLAVLSAITHGGGPRAAAILGPLAAALETVDPAIAALLVQLVTSGLGDSQAKEIWRDLMAPVNYFFRHPVAEQVRHETRVEDHVEMTLKILELRGLQVTDSVRVRVRACSDLDQLKTWSERAVHVADAMDLFDDEED